MQQTFFLPIEAKLIGEYFNTTNAVKNAEKTK